MPYTRAVLLYRHKEVYPDGAIAEVKVWKVPPSARTPEGYKYSMVYIASHKERLLGYDNTEGKGHHRHDKGKETPVEFTSMGSLLAGFFQEVSDLRGEQA